jgi:threonine aldolase
MTKRDGYILGPQTSAEPAMTDRTDRRHFLKASATLAGLGLLPDGVADAIVAPPRAPDRSVNMSHDGLGLPPKDYAALLAQLTSDGRTVEDYYSQNGAVAQLEAACAKLLGKEAAAFMPTGTLANHLAVRALACR